jgi:hypothetical protein
VRYRYDPSYVVNDNVPLSFTTWVGKRREVLGGHRSEMGVSRRVDGLATSRGILPTTPFETLPPRSGDASGGWMWAPWCWLRANTGGQTAIDTKLRSP